MDSVPVRVQDSALITDLMGVLQGLGNREANSFLIDVSCCICGICSKVGRLQGQEFESKLSANKCLCSLSVRLN